MSGNEPWKQPGKGGKPNNRPTQSEARLLATLRSAFHTAQTGKGRGKGKGSDALPPQDSKDNKWAHRRAEWICTCGDTNYVERNTCRTCSKK